MEVYHILYQFLRPCQSQYCNCQIHGDILLLVMSRERSQKNWNCVVEFTPLHFFATALKRESSDRTVMEIPLLDSNELQFYLSEKVTLHGKCETPVIDLTQVFYLLWKSLSNRKSIQIILYATQRSYLHLAAFPYIYRQLTSHRMIGFKRNSAFSTAEFPVNFP